MNWNICGGGLEEIVDLLVAELMWPFVICVQDTTTAPGLWHFAGWTAYINEDTWRRCAVMIPTEWEEAVAVCEARAGAMSLGLRTAGQLTHF
eukprot:2895101-Amphidinium_carterae.1